MKDEKWPYSFTCSTIADAAGLAGYDQLNLKVNTSLERFPQIILHLLDQPTFRRSVESPA